jgi:hypothetical protein
MGSDVSAVLEHGEEVVETQLEDESDFSIEDEPARLIGEGVDELGESGSAGERPAEIGEKDTESDGLLEQGVGVTGLEAGAEIAAEKEGHDDDVSGGARATLLEQERLWGSGNGGHAGETSGAVAAPASILEAPHLLAQSMSIEIEVGGFEESGAVDEEVVGLLKEGEEVGIGGGEEELGHGSEGGGGEWREQRARGHEGSYL